MGAIISTFFQTYFFSAESETKKALGEFGGMIPRENFEILHAVMAMLVRFEYFSGKFCFKIFDPKS